MRLLEIGRRNKEWGMGLKEVKCCIKELEREVDVSKGKREEKS